MFNRQLLAQYFRQFQKDQMMLADDSLRLIFRSESIVRTKKTEWKKVPLAPETASGMEKIVIVKILSSFE